LICDRTRIRTLQFYHSATTVAGFADDSPDQQDLKLEAGLRHLPPELGIEGTGFYIQSVNRSDDLFLFLKRRLGPEDGLRPNQTYQVFFDLVFASNAPSNCGGVGGSPGESVYLKAGSWSALTPDTSRSRLSTISRLKCCWCRSATRWPVRADFDDEAFSAEGNRGSRRSPTRPPAGVVSASEMMRKILHFSTVPMEFLLLTLKM